MELFHFSRVVPPSSDMLALDLNYPRSPGPALLHNYARLIYVPLRPEWERLLVWSVYSKFGDACGWRPEPLRPGARFNVDESRVKLNERFADASSTKRLPGKLSTYEIPSGQPRNGGLRLLGTGLRPSREMDEEARDERSEKARATNYWQVLQLTDGGRAKRAVVRPTLRQAAGD